MWGGYVKEVVALGNVSDNKMLTIGYIGQINL